MKFVLSKNLILRQFKNGLCPVLINLDDGLRTNLNEVLLSFLKLCDGKTDFDNFSFIPNIDILIKIALKNNWITKSEELISPIQQFKIINTPDLPFCQWSITGLCNARCRHCYISKSQNKHKDLTTKEMIHILDKLSDCCVYRVSITGGEPLIRKDFPTLVHEMDKRHIKITGVSTNGFALSDKILDLFEENHMHPMIRFSFDGLGHHDWLRGVDGAEDMTIRAMDLCRERGYEFSLVMCIHKGNYKAIHDTVEFAAEKGAEEMLISPVSVYGGYSGDNDIDVFNMEETFNIYLDYLKMYCKERPKVDLQLAGFVSINHKNIKDYTILPLRKNFKDLENDKSCKTINHTFYISDEGRVIPCINLAGCDFEDKCSKLTEHSFEECLDSLAYKELTHLTINDIVKKNSKCKNCEYLSNCGGGCRGVACAFNNNLFGTDESLCKFFHMKMPEKIKHIMDNA